ncbi:MAG: glutamine amidotransferase [Oligoflexia bacterium]|nr:MAG: glutamine amidotransferase [Oligoflexia bacterium]
MKKIAVILSGCGNKDGAEIQETVSLIIALSQLGAEVTYFAPNKEFQAKNFLTNQAHHEKRNVMAESARITRSQMKDLATLNARDFDALAMPGGYGAAINLSNWAEKGAKCDVIPDLEKAIKEFHRQSKPIGAICIAPAIVARVLGAHKITVTIGNDKETSSEIEKTGALHEDCPVMDYITDRHHKVITTPAYMYNAKPHEVFHGIMGLAKELVEMA